jgi:hypothetical protein
MTTIGPKTLLEETLMALAEAAREWPPEAELFGDGWTPSRSTIQRWCRAGLKVRNEMVRLEHVMLPTGRATPRESLVRFATRVRGEVQSEHADLA